MPKPAFVFIDASNLWQAQKTIGKFFDYGKLMELIKKRHKVSEVVVYYYTAYPADGTREYSTDNRHKFYTFLKKGLGFTVRKKPLKRIQVATAEGIAIEEKGNMDVEMAIDAVHNINKYDVAILFTGDSDFLSLVKYIRSRKKKVYIYSSEGNISSELRTGADGYQDLLKLGDSIWRGQLHHRATKN